MSNWKKKQNVLWLVVAVFYLLFLFNYVAYAQSTLPVSAEVSASAKSLVEAHVKAQVNYDKASLARLTHSQYFEISPVGEFDTREKMLGFYDTPHNAPGPEVSVQEWEVRQFGANVSASAKLQFKMRIGEQTREFAVRATYQLCDEAGQTKICSAHYTPIVAKRGA